MTGLIKKRILEAVKREFYKEWEKIALGQLKQNLSEELKRQILEELLKEQEVYIEFCRDEMALPCYKHLGDSGMDVRAAEDIILMPGETKKIPTGLILGIPEGHEIQVRPRSGNSLNTPLRITNAPGTIDSNYRDELSVIMQNTSPRLYNRETGLFEDLRPDMPTYGLECERNMPGIYKINKGERVAQIVLGRFSSFHFNQVGKGMVKKLGYDRASGFGGTGVK